MITVVVVNESTVLTDADVQACMAALQAQVHNDFAAIYGVDADLKFYPKGKALDFGEWELVFADNSDQVGALGYHETTENGDPIGFVFAKDDIASHTSWTCTASHELLEMLADPDIQQVETQYNADGSMTLRAKEVCDPCEDDQYGYTIDNPLTGKPFALTDGTAVLLSDFVTPQYWNQNAVEDVALDVRGHITKPLTILAGGYISIVQVPKGSNWEQVNAQIAGKFQKGGKAAPVLSRRDRRVNGIQLERRSDR